MCDFFNMKKLAIAVAIIAGSTSANALTIGVYGGYPNASAVDSGLSGFGNTIVSLGALDSASLSGLDAVILGRDVAGNDALGSFVFSGGKLITEWSSAAYGLSLLGGSAADNYSSAFTGDPVIFSAAGLLAGLGASLGASYSDEGATEFFQDFVSLGSATVYATRGSSGATAIAGGSYGAGRVWVNGYDWADDGTAATYQLLNNELSYTSGGTVPEPGSLALLGLGLAGFAANRRAKAKRAS